MSLTKIELENYRRDGYKSGPSVLRSIFNKIELKTRRNCRKTVRHPFTIN